MVELISLIYSSVLILLVAIAYFIGNKTGAGKKDREWKEQLPVHKKEAIAHSRAIIGGNFSEQLAPFLPNFKYQPTECKFLGKPIDLLVFKGMDEKNITEVIFVEVKSGNAHLSTVERKLKEAIEQGKVSWQEYRIPEQLTKKKETADERETTEQQQENNKKKAR